MNFLNDAELAILDGIQRVMGNGFFDTFFSLITKLGDGGVFFIAIGLMLLIFNKTRKCGIMILAALILELVVVNLTMKPLFARVRPYDVNAAYQLLINAPHDYSFPSGHTASAFAFAAAIFAFNKKWGIAAGILALLIGFSRLYLYIHYPTDVAAGLVIGIALGLLGALLTNTVYRTLEKRKKQKEAV